MTTIPPSLVRVPNRLTTELMRGALANAHIDLLNMQVKLSNGRQINRPSDDPIGTSTVTVLDDVIERREQRLRNLSHAGAVLDNVDAALADVTGILIESKGIASSQIGIGSDAETRRNQAHVIDAMLSEITNIANRRYQQLQLFGGTATGEIPMVDLKGGLRYQGQGDGLTTDIGLSRALAVTVSGEQAFGSLSSRVQGNRDLDPRLVGDTRLGDLNGARGLGVSLSTVDVNVGGSLLTVDLTGAHTTQDVADMLTAAIQTVDAGASVQIDPASENRYEITGSAVAITISDPASEATAADLGLDMTFPPGGGLGADLDPRITELTAVSSLTGVTVPLGTIRLANIGQTRDLDLSGAETIQDVMNLVEGLDIGIRVEIAETGDRLNFINELSGGAMSIAEVAGGTTATELGVRSFTTDTRLDEFNDGLGVQIRTGSVDAVTGAPDPAADLDFRIATKDGVTMIDVDLAGATTVQDVLDAINTAATGAGLVVGVDFEATLAADGNGIRLVDNTGAVGATTSVTALNGSYAAQDLGLAGSTTAAELVGEDRATVAVDSVFSHLIALRDALRTNDERAITLAAERIEGDIARATETRAQVGVRARRVANAVIREEDLQIQDRALRSEVQDLDYTDATMRFALLQQQLQAGLATAGRISSFSLLDFLR